MAIVAMRKVRKNLMVEGLGQPIYVKRTSHSREMLVAEPFDLQIVDPL
jgi:hypothetical protein